MMLLFASGTSTSRLIALWAPRSGAASEWANASFGAAMHVAMHTGAKLRHPFRRRDSEEEADDVKELEDGEDESCERPGRAVYADGRIEPSFGPAPIGEEFDEEEEEDEEIDDITSANYRITRLDAAKKRKKHTGLSRQDPPGEPYEPPSIKLLQPQP